VVYISVSDAEPLLLSFRVKYYPSDLEKLQEELTRYTFYLFPLPSRLFFHMYLSLSVCLFVCYSRTTDLYETLQNG